MGMAGDHLVGDRRHHVGEGEVARLVGHLGMEDHLQQQIAQFTPQPLHVAVRDRLGDLVLLLDGVGRDGGEILLDVPGAAADRRSQAAHDFQQAGDVAGGGVGLRVRHGRASYGARGPAQPKLRGSAGLYGNIA